MLSKRLGGALLAAMLLLAGSFTARAQNPITIGFGMALTGGLARTGGRPCSRCRSGKRRSMPKAACWAAGETGLLR